MTSGADAFRVDVSPDGRRVAAARLDGSVRVWDMETGREAFTVDSDPVLPPHGDLAWGPDGEHLAVSADAPLGGRGRATVVDHAGRQLAERQAPERTVLAGVSFTPDGDRLVAARVPTWPVSAEEGVVIWDWRQGDVAPLIDTPAGLVKSSPTGDLVATTARRPKAIELTGEGETVDVWDPATGRRVASLEGNTGGVLDIAFSADGSRLATGSIDGTVRIWDPSSGEQLLVLRGHDAAVSSVAFSPDGAQLASVGTEGAVRVWALELEDLLEIAEDEVTRTFTDDECRQYLHAQRCP